MKNTAFIIILSILASTLTAQITSARVTYQESTQLNLSDNEDVDPGMKALLSQLPDQFTTTSELLFSEKAAIYSERKELNEDFSAEQGDRKITFKISQGTPEVYYVDLTTNTTLQKRNIFEREIQIEDEVARIDWTLTEESDTDAKSTLPVKKAIGITSQGDTLTAWYTTSIPVSTGPKTFGGLPGLIVKLIDDNKTYQLTAIELLREAPEIDPPFTGGKTITLEKYEEIYEKKTAAFKKGMRGKVITAGGQ